MAKLLKFLKKTVNSLMRTGWNWLGKRSSILPNTIRQLPAIWRSKLGKELQNNEGSSHRRRRS